MINLLKGLVLAAVIAAPIAISAPAVQAKTPISANKSSKVHHTKHHSRHHKAAHAKAYSKNALKK